VSGFLFGERCTGLEITLSWLSCTYQETPQEGVIRAVQTPADMHSNVLSCSSQTGTGSAGLPTLPKSCFCLLTLRDCLKPRSSHSVSGTSLRGSPSDEVEPVGLRKRVHYNMRQPEPEAPSPHQLRQSTPKGNPEPEQSKPNAWPPIISRAADPFRCHICPLQCSCTTSQAAV
jgi:hypothetical protein